MRTDPLTRPLFAATTLALLTASAGCAKKAQPEPMTVAEAVSEVDPEFLADPWADPSQPWQVPAMAWTELDDGVKVYDFMEGTGEPVVRNQVVTVHYAGWIEGGSSFDNSVQRGLGPLEVILSPDEMVPGWVRGMQGMRVGGLRQIRVPPELGYGDKAQGLVPPGSTLLFDVQLMSAGEVREVPLQPEVDFDSSGLAALDSGVERVDLTVGTGVEAQERSRVRVEYTIWDGHGGVSYSTFHRMEPYWFLLGGERAEAPPLPGLDEGIRGMKVGGVRFIRMPPRAPGGDAAEGPASGETMTALVELEAVTGPHEPPAAMPVPDPGLWVATDSGLKYVDLVEGSGPSPASGKQVIVEYAGWLEDGTLIDASLDRRQPFVFEFGTGKVVAGFDQAVKDMKVGGSRLVHVPPELGYGDKARGKIPADAVTIYQIALVGVR